MRRLFIFGKTIFGVELNTIIEGKHENKKLNIRHLFIRGKTILGWNEI